MMITCSRFLGFHFYLGFYFNISLYRVLILLLLVLSWNFSDEVQPLKCEFLHLLAADRASF